MIERVVYCSSLEVQRNAASPSLSEAIKRLLEAEKRAHKAMLLRAFDCVEAVVNQTFEFIVRDQDRLPPQQPLASSLGEHD